MRMLFTCRPGDGHFHPLLPLAAAARDRGHEVCFASGEPIATKARGLGFASEVVGLSEAETLARRSALLGGVPLAKGEIRTFAFGRWFSEVETPPRLAVLETVCRRLRPDLLIHEPAELAGPLAAAGLGIPWVTVGYGSLLPPELPPLAAAALGPLWRSHGLEVPTNAGLYEHLYVDPCPASMQISAIKTLPATIQIRPGSAGVKQPFVNHVEAGRVYVTFGTMWDVQATGWALMQATVAGTADAARSVVVTLGARAHPSRLGKLPSHVEVHPYVPQDEILQSCAGMVSHAGAGTLLGALAWGVPSVLLPQHSDQHDNAALAVLAGTALALDPHAITREVVVAAVSRILSDPTMTPGLGQVRQELATAADVHTVMARVEHLAQQNSASRR